MTTALAGQVALVTGASRGIGRAIALRLGRAGASVFVNFVRDRGAAVETVRRISEIGGQAKEIGFDVTDDAAVREGVAEVCKGTNTLDILVNNAGLSIDNLVLRLKAKEWEDVVNVNLRGTFHCTKAALRPMLRARYGRIVNIGSVVGSMGNAGQAAYAAAKAGIVGFTKATAREVAARGITLNTVAPGFIETEMVSHLPEARRSEYLNVIPAGRFGTAEEVADVVGFLVRRESGYITGQVVGINGGLYM